MLPYKQDSLSLTQFGHVWKPKKIHDT